MNRKKAAILTFGCQMNKYDSEVIAGLLDTEGYAVTSEVGEADLILVNTCSIRAKAELRMYSHLGHLKRLKTLRPDLRIGVCGCVAQREGRTILERAPFVDLVFGTRNITRLPHLLAQRDQSGVSVADVAPAPPEEADYDLPIKRTSDFQAWVTIMTGCDHRCSFCVVPMTRGPERSRPSREILREVRQLADEGYKEVTLLGQTVNSYFADIAFPELLKVVDGVDGFERIRFLTSHPKDVTEGLIEQMTVLPKVCEHIHLPVQSGSDRVLKVMERGHGADYYLSVVEALREAMPKIGLSSDIIVGFPGETEADFQQTLELLETVEFDSIFLFKYSPRPDTPAAEMPDQVPEEVKQSRFQQTLDLQNGISQKRNERLLGCAVEVLVEGVSTKDPSMLTGRSRSNKLVHFPTEPGLSAGELVDITIIRAKLHTLEGIWARH